MRESSEQESEPRQCADLCHGIYVGDSEHSSSVSQASSHATYVLLSK